MVAQILSPRKSNIRICVVTLQLTHLTTLKRMNLYPLYKTPSWVTSKKNPFSKSYFSYFFSPLLWLYYIPKNVYHTQYSSFLIAWPLPCKLQKKEGKNCTLKRSLTQSSFIMYIYANDTFVYSRKRLSLPPWSVFQPCGMHGERRQTGFVSRDWFLYESYTGGKIWRFALQWLPPAPIV